MKNYLHFATSIAQRVAVQAEQVLAFQVGFAFNGGLTAQQLHDGLAGGGFAAARFADQGQGLARTNVKRHTVHRREIASGALQQTTAYRKAHAEVLHAEQWRGAKFGSVDRSRRSGLLRRYRSGQLGLRRRLVSVGVKQATNAAAACGQELRLRVVARLKCAVAARRKPARGELLPQRRHRAGNGGQAAPALGRVGQRTQQQTRIRVLRRGKKFFGRRHFNDLPGVHQRHLVGHARDHRQIVGDQQQAHALFFLQLLQQVQNLRLDGHVECRGRLVGHQKIRLGGQGHGNHHALLLTATHAKRVVVDAPFGLGYAHLAQPLNRTRPRCRTAQRGVRLDGLDDLITHPHHRVQAGGRLLKNHADLAAADGPHARLGQGKNLSALQLQRAVGHAAVVGQQTHQRQGRHAFAATRFANQRKSFTPSNAKR